MLEKTAIEAVVASVIESTDAFLVEVKISKDNDVVVEIDSDTGVDIDICVKINDAILAAFDRDVEDYSLEVGSSGLTSPFKVKRQYDKNIGNEVEVLSEGKKYVGVLKSTDAEGFVIESMIKQKGEKKPSPVLFTFSYDKVKYTKYNLKFE